MKAAAGFVLCFVLFLALLFCPPLWAGADAAPNSLSYTVDAVPGGGLRVALSFPGDGTGRTRLHLPGCFSGQTALCKNIHNLSALSPNTVLADTDAPEVKQVTFPPNQTVQVQYEVAPDPAQGADTPGAYFRPALRPTYFHFIGATVWAYPSQYGRPLSVTLHWHLPAGWAFAGSLGTEPGEQSFTGTVEQFRETVYLGGDFRLQTVQAAGKPVTVAVRGKWKFSDRDFAMLAGRVAAAERDFWQDSDFPYYLVALLPVSGPEAGGDGGVELTRSVALFQPQSRGLDYGLRYVLAHEMFHTWNADKMQAADQPLLWFSEGFTDYYARVLLLRAGLLSVDDYAREFNRVAREYTQSPCRNCRGAEADADFYSGTPLARLPYQQGALLAAHWDAAIRRATSGAHSLGDVLRDLRRDAAPMSAERVCAAVRRYAPLDAAGGLDATGEVERVVTQGGTLIPDPDALGPGYALQTVRVPPFELGFDGPATIAGRAVAGVKPGSQAFQAGLRDGQEVVFCAPFVMGDADQHLRLTVRDLTGGTRDVEFMPAGDGLPTPQYVRRKQAATDQVCLAWLGNLPPASGR